MKPPKILIRSLGMLPLLLWPVGGHGQEASDAPGRAAQKTLAEYPQSAPFRAVVAPHFSGNLGMSSPFPTTQKHLLFYSTWFLGGAPNVAMQCVVDDKGRGVASREVYAWASQAAHSANVSAAQIPTLKTALRKLPPSAAKPKLADLLIVSYRKQNGWTTRIYNRAHLPGAVLAVFKITGAPLR